MHIFIGIRRFLSERTEILNINSQSGQAGIILLLITVVMVTISLSITSRTVTDIRISKQEEETTRAFNAAEAGIEEALRQDITSIAGGSINVGGIQANYTVTESEIKFILEELETVEVDVNSTPGETVIIEWGNDGETCDLSIDPYASIELVLIDGSGNITRIAYSGNSCDRMSGVTPDGFDSSTAVDAPSQYRWQVSISAADVDLLRIRAVYTSTPIRVTESDPNVLSTQSWTIHSEAQAPGGETRAIEVTQNAPAPPSIFDFVIFSGAGNLSK